MPPGRPRTITEVRRAEVAALVSAGLNIPEAARQVGCSLRTLRRELKDDPAFRRQVDDARVSSQLDPLRLMRAAASTHWRAAAWLLERSDSERFCQRTPGRCRLEDAAAAMDELIELALCEIPDGPARTAAFPRLATASQRLLTQLAAPGRSFRRKRPTPHSDIARHLRRD